MQMADPLIRTKLGPPYIRPALVPRPRLQKQMAQGLRGPLTLIIAPAGFGKTTLAAACAAGCDFPAAWLSLDKDDNRNGRFLHYLIAALQTADPAIGQEAAQLMAAASQLPPELILTSLVNDLDSSGQEIALVLDDYHVISSQAVHQAVTFLLEHSPQICHLVIVGRSDPPLPVVRLRARGQLVELRAADLSFSETEAAHFLNDIMGLHLDAAAAARLAARTEGWITGLQLAALSLRDRDDVSGFIEHFSGTNRHILDYLLDEVLSREPKAVQTFLLQTAILNRLTGSLCDAVTGTSGSQKMLEQLEQRSLFVVPLDDERRWYRYHHLFADLLQARLQQAGHEPAARLRARAAAWCEHNGQPAAAVDYALAAHDFEHAAYLVAHYWGHASSAGEIETVWSWLNALPEAIIKNSAPLSVATCWVLWLRGQIGLMEAPLADAERALHAQGAGDGLTADLPAQIAALRSFVVRYRHQFDTAVALAQQALTLVPDKLPSQTNARLHALIYLALASAYDGAGDLQKAADAYADTIRWNRSGTSAAGVAGITYRMIGVLRLLGRLREAEAACREALAYLDAQNMARLPAAGILHLAMAEVLLEQNELEAAEAHISQGIELGKWSGRLDAARNAVHALARLRLARGDGVGALTAVQEAEASLSDPPSPLAQSELLALKTRLLLRQGAVREAAPCAAEAVRLAGGDQGQTGQMAALSAYRVLLAQDKLDELIEQLTQAVDSGGENGRFGVAIELYILRSLAWLRQNKLPAAMADIEQALVLAAPEGYVRLFLDEGRPLQMLLTQWLGRAAGGELQKYAVSLLKQFDAEQPITAAAPEPVHSISPLIEPLSPRELEVLHIMALGKTNKQIAQQLVVSRGTVKAHTAAIYRKLDVANRTEAVARARQLGLLS